MRYEKMEMKHKSFWQLEKAPEFGPLPGDIQVGGPLLLKSARLWNTTKQTQRRFPLAPGLCWWGLTKAGVMVSLAGEEPSCALKCHDKPFVIGIHGAQPAGWDNEYFLKAEFVQYPL